MVDQGTIYRVFRYSETLIITPTEIIDPNDENQELTFSIKSLIAREELKAIVKRMQRGRRASAGEGKYWNPSTISSIIKNEVYLGHIIWGKVKHIKRNGKYFKRKVPAEHWQRHENAHEAIVTKELFERANTAHSNRWRTPTVQTKKLSNPLAGILVCELCGHSMVYQPRKDRPNPQVRCVQPSCKNVQKGASLKLVEERILQGLNEIVDVFEIEVDMIQVKSKKTNQTPLKQKALVNKLTELEELQKQKDSLHDFLERGVCDIDTFMERQKSIVERIKNTEGEVQKLQEEINHEKIQEENLNLFLPKVKNVLAAYHAIDDIENKNRLLKTVLEKATYLRKKDWKKKDEFILKLYTNF